MSDHLNWDTAGAGDISFRSSTVGVDMLMHPRMQIQDNDISPFGDDDLDKVFERTLVGWQSLQDNTQQSLSEVKSEKTEINFIGDNFQRQLDAACRERFHGGLKGDQGCNEDDNAPLETAHESLTSKPALISTTAP
ncbi:hypothetical protein EsH8_II_000510 [Colletotrichum jinshuiense]